jgi:tRNA (Thr-GGU) A37 N-methylase
MSDAPRPGEAVLPAAPTVDAGLTFIGRIRTPWRERRDCPRQGALDGPPCEVEVFEPWRPALDGLGRYAEIELLYWMDRARRDLLT